VGASPDQLEAEIAQTREDLAVTIGQIEAKVGGMKQSAKDSVKPANLIRLRGVQIGAGVIAAYVALKVYLHRRRPH
jgi:hypothetical protein